MMNSKVCVALVVGLLLPTVATAQSSPAIPMMIEARVPMTPAPVFAKDTQHLLYEILFTNHLPMTATLVGVEVRGDDAEGPLLVSYEGDELADNIGVVGNRGAEAEERPNIAAGGTAMVWVLIRIPASDAVPKRLHQLATFTTEAGDETRTGSVRFETPVLPSTEVIALGPPLVGGPWLVGNGLSNDAGHRRTPLPLDGRPDFAQRYAIDYVMAGENEKTYKGDQLDNASYYAYDKEVIAVADAVVSFTYDGVPENIPGKDSRAVQITIESAPGNSVVLDLGSGRYAVYAHLIPGSLEVDVGDRVRRGQVIARLGNSGNSTEPHLHFHVIDRNSVLAGEGLPYVHHSFTWLGTCEREAEDDEEKKRACTLGEGEARYGELPIRDHVVSFPE